MRYRQSLDAITFSEVTRVLLCLGVTSKFHLAIMSRFFWVRLFSTFFVLSPACLSNLSQSLGMKQISYRVSSPVVNLHMTGTH